MSLTAENKIKVLFHLCFPLTTLDKGNTNFNSVVEDRLEIEDQTICDQVTEMLKCLDDAFAEIKQAKKCLKVSRVDNITMNQDHYMNTKHDYNRLVGKLSCMIDIPSRHCGGKIRVRV